jgi:hypothetical protein
MFGKFRKLGVVRGRDLDIDTVGALSHAPSNPLGPADRNYECAEK